MPGGDILGSVVGSVVGGLFGDEGGGSQQTADTSPWKPVQPYLIGNDNIKGVLPEAEKLFRTGNITPQMQSIIDKQTAYINKVLNDQSYQGVSDVANTAVNGGFDVYLPHIFASPDPIGPNAYMNDVAKTIESRMNRNMKENVLPSIRGGAVANGYGSSRQGIAEGLAMRDTQEGINNTIAPLYANAYETYANRLMNNDQFNTNLGLAVGNQNIAASQSSLANRLQGANLLGSGVNNQLGLLSGLFNLATKPIDYNWNNLSHYASIVNPAAGLGGSTTGTMQQQGSLVNNMLGGAMLGNSIGGKFGGRTVGDPWIGSNTNIYSGPITGIWS